MIFFGTFKSLQKENSFFPFPSDIITDGNIFIELNENESKCTLRYSNNTFLSLTPKIIKDDKLPHILNIQCTIQNKEFYFTFILTDDNHIPLNEKILGNYFIKNPDDYGSIEIIRYK